MEGSFVPLTPLDLLLMQGDELSGLHLLPPSQIPTREISPLNLDHTDPLPSLVLSSLAVMNAPGMAKLSAMQDAADKIRFIKEGSTHEASQTFESQVTGVHSTLAHYLMGSKNMILKLGLFLNSPIDGSFSNETVQKVVDLAGCVTAYFTEMQGAYCEEIDKILEVEKVLPALHGGIEKKYLLKLLKTWMETIMLNLKRTTSEEHNLLACISVLCENVYKLYQSRVQAHEELRSALSGPLEALHQSIEKTLALYTEIVGHNFYFKKQMEFLIIQIRNSRDLVQECLAFKNLRERLDKEAPSWEWGVEVDKKSPDGMTRGEKKALGGTTGGIKKENIGFKSDGGETGGA